MNQFKTEILSIKELLKKETNIQFIIPTYQRPYVWSEIEIKKLLEDVYDSYGNKNDSIYFIGNVYVTKNKESKYDVIDGQQRFTTLWLIALAFKMSKKIQENLLFSNFLEYGKSIRLNFTIRKDVEQYLRGLLQGNTAFYTQTEIQENEFLKNIASGIATIRGFIETLDNTTIIKLSNYFYTNVMFVYNTAPLQTDLNSLFVALGNSGIQLEQTDILKAQLLKKVENKFVYSKIWEACENMDDYFEKNISAIFKTSNIINKGEELDVYRKYSPVIFLIEKNTDEDFDKIPMTIEKIIESGTITIKEDIIQKLKSNKCRSIIPFSILLLHTLRIYNKQKEQEDFEQPFDKKNLLQIFKPLTDKSSTEIERFFLLLWEVRYLFDAFIVKWRYDSDEDNSVNEDEKLRLTKFQGDSSPRENIANTNSSMLQSVLYFTGGYNQQFWITPFLFYLLENENIDEQTINFELEKIDNNMLPGDKKYSSWHLLDAQNRNKKVDDIKGKIGIEECLGTGFNHYWFYKLEYLLWKEWDKNDDRKKQEIFKRYRITSKNSIEHIFPQNEEYNKKLNDDNIDWLNSFGNLSLLSVGQNSSYSNQDVDKKRIDFSKKEIFDSLKLEKIYNYSKWDVDEIEDHQNEMIGLFKKHYG